jgi:trk system potassium uptake protein
MIDGKDKFIIIVGCGRFGASLAKALIKQNKNLVVIDPDPHAFQRLPNDFSGFLLEGNGAELDILKNAKIQKADAVITTTNDDSVNILIAQIAKTIFKVPKVLAILFEPARQEVYTEIEVETVCPSMLTVNEILGIMPGLQKLENIEVN